MTSVVVASGSFAARHATHLAAVAIPVAMVVVALAVDSVKSRRKRRGTTPVKLPGRASIALRVAAVASVGAAVVHLRVLPEHAEESAWYGAFFAAAALAQIGGAALLLRTAVTRRFVALLVMGNAAVVGLWLFTRLVGVPLGPDAGSTESFGALDVIASMFEGVVVAACAGALRPRRVRTTVALPHPGASRVNVA